jgi:hypothetical protein
MKNQYTIAMAKQLAEDAISLSEITPTSIEYAKLIKFCAIAMADNEQEDWLIAAKVYLRFIRKFPDLE